MQGTAADVIKVAMMQDSRSACGRGEGLRASCSRCTTGCLLEVTETELSAVRDLVRAEMVGAYPLDPALAVDVGAGDELGGSQVVTNRFSSATTQWEERSTRLPDRQIRPKGERASNGGLQPWRS